MHVKENMLRTNKIVTHAFHKVNARRILKQLVQIVVNLNYYTIILPVGQQCVCGGQKFVDLSRT